MPASRTIHDAKASSSTVHRLGTSALATLFPLPEVVPAPRFPQRPKAMAVCVGERSDRVTWLLACVVDR